MSHFPFHARLPALATRFLLLACLVLSGGGCNFIHNYGSGTHLDEARERPQKHKAAKAATMQAEVTTDAAGQVVSINFVRSSGSSAVDNYVADSIRRNWPGAPSTRALVEIEYNPGTGFSDPKLISSSPVS